MTGDEDRSADEIERDMRGTRAALSRTLDAIEDKLRTRHLMQEGLTMVTESFTDPAGGHTGVASILRSNPIAFALIGAGIACFVAGNTRLLDRIAEDDRVQGAVRQISDIAGSIGDSAAAGGTAAADIAGGWVHRAADAVRYTGNSVIARAGAYTNTRAARTAGDLWERSALLVGAAGVVAGALLATALPPLRLERD